MRITKLQTEQRMKAIEHLSIDVIGLLRIYIAIAMVDPNELISVKVGCCRFCHGEGHRYQWKEREFMAECDAAADRKDGKLPDIGGGFGFDHTVPPHPDCPECRGEGVHRLVPKDTTKLSPGALHLYRGAQQTKEGIKILFGDKDKALDQIGRILGAFDDRLRIDLQARVKSLQITTTDPAEAARAYMTLIQG